MPHTLRNAKIRDIRDKVQSSDEARMIVLMVFL